MISRQPDGSHHADSSQAAFEGWAALNNVPWADIGTAIAKGFDCLYPAQPSVGPSGT